MQCLKVTVLTRIHRPLVLNLHNPQSATHRKYNFSFHLANLTHSYYCISYRKSLQLKKAEPLILLSVRSLGFYYLILISDCCNVLLSPRQGKDKFIILVCHFHIWKLLGPIYVTAENVVPTSWHFVGFHLGSWSSVGLTKACVFLLSEGQYIRQNSNGPRDTR